MQPLGPLGFASRTCTSRSGCADAGYVEYFERYAFATVAGAGHRVPENQPLAAVTMYERFIATGSLDTDVVEAMENS